MMHGIPLHLFNVLKDSTLKAQFLILIDQQCQI